MQLYQEKFFPKKMKINSGNSRERIFVYNFDWFWGEFGFCFSGKFARKFEDFLESSAREQTVNNSLKSPLLSSFNRKSISIISLNISFRCHWKKPLHLRNSIISWRDFLVHASWPWREKVMMKADTYKSMSKQHKYDHLCERTFRLCVT